MAPVEPTPPVRLEPFDTSGGCRLGKLFGQEQPGLLRVDGIVGEYEGVTFS